MGGSPLTHLRMFLVAAASNGGVFMQLNEIIETGIFFMVFADLNVFLPQYGLKDHITDAYGECEGRLSAPHEAPEDFEEEILKPRGAQGLQ